MVTRKTRLMSALLAILMVVSMLTAFVLPVSAEDSYQSVRTVEEAVTSGNYAVGSVADWMYLFQNHATLFANRNITIHLTSDIDLNDTAASTFTGFENPLFSFDGHDYTIKNWGTKDAFAPGGRGLFYLNSNGSGYGMNSLKNFKVQNCYIQPNTSGIGLVLGIAGTINAGLSGLPATITLENIHISNCLVETVNEVAALFVGRFNGQTTSTLVVKNCSAVNNTLNQKASSTGLGDHLALVVGKINEKTDGQDITVDISDIYLRGNTVQKYNATTKDYGVALVFGTYEDLAATIKVSNVGAFDNKVAALGEANLLGKLTSSSITSGSSFKNILFSGNTLEASSKWIWAGNPQRTDYTGWTFENIYRNNADSMSGAKAEVLKDSTWFTSGEAAYALNSELTNPTFYWSLGKDDEGNTIIVPGTAETQVRKLTVSRQKADGSYENEELYFNGTSAVSIAHSASYALAEASDNVTDKNDTGEAVTFTMPQADATVKLDLTSPDFTEVEALIAKYEPYAEENKFDFFTKGAAMKAVYEDSVSVVKDYKNCDKEQYEAAYVAIADVVADEAEITDRSLSLSFTDENNYKAPNGKDYKLFAEYGANHWIVADADDWRGLVEGSASDNFSGETIHLVDDIDMENKAVAPLGGNWASGAFKGTLDGHGHVFENILIQCSPDASGNFYVGLVGYLNGGTIRNLGVASGLVRAYGSAFGEAMVSGIAGGMTGGAKIINCWNGATINSRDYKGSDSTSGIARIESGYIDGCFNIGSIISGNWSGGISGAAHTYKIYNSFTIGHLESDNISGLARWTANTYKSNSMNSYIASDDSTDYYCLHGVDKTDAGRATANADMTAYMLSANAYFTGELAAKLNANWKSDNGNTARYTVKDGKTVLVTDASKQTRTVTYVCNGYSDTYEYVNAGDTVTLDYATGATYVVTGATVEGNAFTMPTNDVTVNVTLPEGAVNLALLKAAVAAWDGKNPSYFVSTEDSNVTLKSLIEQANSYINGTVGTTQADVDALTAKINGSFVLADYPNYPKASEVDTYTELGAKNFLVADLDDLNYVAENTAKFTAAYTLHFVENATIVVGENDAANSLAGINSSIDGHGVTIEGVTHVGFDGASDYAQDGWLGSFGGAYVKNLTMKDWTGTNMSKAGGLLIGEVEAANLTVENITATGCTVSASESNRLGISLLVGAVTKNYRSVAFKDITIEKCTMNRGAAGGNSGFLLGRAWWDNGSADNSDGGSVTVENVYLNNNKINDNVNDALGAGILLGEMTEKSFTISNVGVFNTTFGEGAKVAGVLVGHLKNGAALTVTNVLAGNNGDATTLINQNVNDGTNSYNKETATVVTPTNVYADTDYVVSGAAEVANTATTDIFGGAAVAALNAAGVEKTWAIGADGTPYMAEAGLPKAVHFGLSTVEYTHECALDLTLYTDDQGKLIGLDEEALEQQAYWTDDQKAAWNEVITETEFLGAPWPAHTEAHAEELSYTPLENDQHTVTCDHVEDNGAACQYSETKNCDLKHEPVNKDARPKDAQHKQVCVCKNETAAEACTPEIVDSKDATIDEAGYIKYECKTCGYTHTETLPKLVGMDVKAGDAYVGGSVEAVVSVKNNPGVAGLWLKITYKNTELQWSGIDALTDEPVALAPSEVVNNGDGTSTVTVAMTFNGDTYTGDDMFKITFKALAKAESAFSIEVTEACDYRGGEVKVRDYTGSITIYDYVRGDINGDKKVSIADAVLLLRVANGDETVNNLGINLDLNAANVDGKNGVDLNDVIMVLQYLNGSIDAL